MNLILNHNFTVYSKGTKKLNSDELCKQAAIAKKQAWTLF
jgi:hypothetical protein